MLCVGNQEKCEPDRHISLNLCSNYSVVLALDYLFDYLTILSTVCNNDNVGMRNNSQCEDLTISIGIYHLIIHRVAVNLKRWENYFKIHTLMSLIPHLFHNNDDALSCISNVSTFFVQIQFNREASLAFLVDFLSIFGGRLIDNVKRGRFSLKQPRASQFLAVQLNMLTGS